MVFLEISQNSQENTCAGVSFFNKVAGLSPAILLKNRLAHVFSGEFCEISKNIFFTEHARTTASDLMKIFPLHYRYHKHVTTFFNLPMQFFPFHPRWQAHS